MIRVSTKRTALLAVLLVLGTTAYGQNPVWPLKGEIDLSSGYGDLRSGRFHVGLDLRTGGRIGAKVFAPVDGFVWRVKMSYSGYGKGLYFKGNDGSVYVFGHLSGFNDAVAKAVVSEQFRKERYFVDITFPQDSLPVQKGNLIAYSGQTGVGAPHLHFEKRTPDNLPVNPLLHGFDLADAVAPTFERVGFQLLDDNSLFAQGRRKMFVPVRKIASGKYRVEGTVALDAPFGLLIDGYDQMRAGGMKQAIHHLALYIDSVPFYESTFDTLTFDVGAVVGLVFDPLEAANGEKRVRRVYRPVPEEMIWPEARASYGGSALGSCAYGIDSPPREGVHQVLVVGEDVSGNHSELRLTFEYVEAGSKKSVVVHSDYQVAEQDNPEVTEFQITEDGFVGKVKVGAGYRRLFFPPSPPDATFVNQRDRLFYELINGLKEHGTVIDVVGRSKGAEVTSSDREFTLTIKDGALFRSQFISVSSVPSPTRTGWQFRSALYLVKPQTSITKESFGVSIRLDSTAAHDRRAGLCWCAEIGDNWVWIDRGNLGDSIASGSASGGGLFGVLADLVPPTVTAINLVPGRKYSDRKPEVRFSMRDNLSGIEDDRSIEVHIDNRWLLPELDIETGRCVATLAEPLDLGRHTLTISVRDRAGNRTEKRVEFETVKDSKR
jgi:hypothetical protein